MATILIIDDDKNALKMLAQGLKLEGYDVLTASSGEEAVRVCASHRADVALLDILMPGGMDGLETLTKLKQMQPELSVVMMSAQKEIETAVKAMELGARRYLVKPVGLDEILHAIVPFVELARLSQENAALRDQLAPKTDMIGESVSIQRLRAQIRQVASSDLSVLITGENGTGKELVANAIHQQSRRSRKPFVKLNCAALPDELIESELFGHERGAFTGAAAQRRGKFELADGGALFLDEVGDMSLKAQAKVLRVLEYGELERLGGSQTLRVDVRVIAATNKELDKAIENGTFRQDLYFRLNVVPIHVPALRERMEDLPLLVRHFIEQFHRDSARPPKVIDPAAVRVLQSYHWPGNIRELKNIIERLLIMIDRDVILPDDAASVLPISDAASPTPTPYGSPLREGRLSEPGYLAEKTLADMVDEAEASIILKALEANDWNIKRTAEQLQIERSNFYKKLAKYNIKRPDSE
jgi:two-component system nitrogen regulation response regulator NtrX